MLRCVAIPEKEFLKPKDGVVYPCTQWPYDLLFHGGSGGHQRLTGPPRQATFMSDGHQAAGGGPPRLGPVGHKGDLPAPHARQALFIHQN
jgi:hypothetical protein